MFCCRVWSCSWVVNWHIILDTVGLRSERLPCPETAAPHSVQKTSKWGLITLPCWILPSYSTFVLVISAKSPNYIAAAFLPSLCFIELCQASETSVYNWCSFWGDLWEDKVEDNMCRTRQAPFSNDKTKQLCEMSWVYVRSWTCCCLVVFCCQDHLYAFIWFYRFFLNAPVCEGDIVSAFPRYSSPQGYFN